MGDARSDRQPEFVGWGAAGGGVEGPAGLGGATDFPAVVGAEVVVPAAEARLSHEAVAS
jgi:hypothetical protein